MPVFSIIIANWTFIFAVCEIAQVIKQAVFMLEATGLMPVFSNVIMSITIL